jgi:proteic killer suppression protein
MRLGFASAEMRKVCTDQAQMKRRYDLKVVKTLRRRLQELVAAESMEDLLLGTGKWESLRGDRAGQWSARLSANWRLIVTPVSDMEVDVMVVDIEDYHKR